MLNFARANPVPLFRLADENFIIHSAARFISPIPPTLSIKFLLKRFTPTVNFNPGDTSPQLFEN